MDENKRTKLHEIGYKINPSCATCEHFRQHSDEDFGECLENQYQHLKHSGGKRFLSVFKYGSCDKYEQQPRMEYLIHGFKEFVR